MEEQKEEQQDLEEEAITTLKNIEQDLEEIKNRTPSRRMSFINGLWHGAGAVIGGIVGLTLLGWALSAFGVIPGLRDIAEYMQIAVDNFNRP